MTLWDPDVLGQGLARQSRSADDGFPRHRRVKSLCVHLLWGAGPVCSATKKKPCDSLQQVGDLVEAVAMRNRECCQPRCCPHRPVGSCGQKGHHHLVVAKASCHEERRLSCLVGLVDVRALLEEDFGDLQVTPLRGHQQRCVPSVRCLLHVRAVLQQQLDHAGLVQSGGLEKRGATDLCRGPIHLDATPSLPPNQEPPRRLHLSIVCCPPQWRFFRPLPPDRTAARREGRTVQLRVTSVEGPELWQRRHELETSLKPKARLHVHCLELMQVCERLHCAFERHAPKQIQLAQLAEASEWLEGATEACGHGDVQELQRAVEGGKRFQRARNGFVPGKVDVHQLRTGAQRDEEDAPVVARRAGHVAELHLLGGGHHRVEGLTNICFKKFTSLPFVACFLAISSSNVSGSTGNSRVARRTCWNNQLMPLLLSVSIFLLPTRRTQLSAVGRSTALFWSLIIVETSDSKYGHAESLYPVRFTTGQLTVHSRHSVPT